MEYVYFAACTLFPSDVSMRQTVDFMLVVSGNNKKKTHISLFVSLTISYWIFYNGYHCWIGEPSIFVCKNVSALKIAVDQKLEMPLGTLRNEKDTILLDRLFYTSTTGNWVYGHSTLPRDFLFVGFYPVSPILFHSALLQQ